MTIFLCGFMGCGKSTVGKLLARKTGCGFYDTDELIVEKENMTIPKIFAEKGEPYFRQAEKETVKSLCGKKAVVACGGGAMLNAESAKNASESGMVIFLDVPFETCYERICGDENRPIAVSSSKEELYERFSKRHQIYLENSTLHIQCEGSPAEVTEIILNSIKGMK